MRFYKIASWLSLMAAAMSSLLYWLLIRHTFRETWFYEGWVWLAHLALAAIGLTLGLVAIRRRPSVSAIGALVSCYWLVAQFLL